MKKCLMLVLLQAFVLAALAQGDADQMKKKKKTGRPFYVGAGINFARITGDYTDGLKTLTGWQVGVGTRAVDFTQNLGLDVGVFYSLQGARYKDNYGSEKELLSYINVPIQARYQWPNGFFGSAGLQPGFLVAAKSKYNGNSEDIKDYFKTFDLAVPVGVGVQTKAGAEVGLYIAPGLINLNDDSNASTNHNLVGSIRASYRF